MAMLVFDLHKVSISQPCCYSFSAVLAGENRKESEKRKDMCTVVAEGGLSVVEGVLAFPFSPHMLFSRLDNCSIYTNLQG